MLTKDERTLLENVLGSLDRLFDRESTAADIYALLFATGKALGGTRFWSAFELPIQEIEKAVRLNTPHDKKRDLALASTDQLRKFVAEELRADATVNPKRRHLP